ncbi:hypothetical protein [Rhodospirillaceae bacterium SYSU D60014]|uniref:hypothetical protein n=1 Tax=Virgifigura deserti TaxID=2268457 RepID=UPI000E66BBFA
MAGVALLPGCSSDPDPIDPRTPAAAAVPGPEEWRAVAASIASEIADVLEEREADLPVSLMPVYSAVPVDLYDILLAEFVLAGVPVAAEEDSPTALHCRVSTSGTAERPRGAVSVGPDPTAETVVLCLLAIEDRYVAAARRILQPQERDRSPSGLVLRVSG